MKNNLFIRIVILFLLLPAFQLACHAQSSTHYEISISETGVEYDDAGLTSLRQQLQSNKSISGLKLTYSNNAAVITFSSTSSAIDLWDNLSAGVKQPFKVSSIDDHHIVLTGKSNAANGTSANSSAQTGDDDCRTCYFNLCKYDLTRSFQGVIYKGIRYDQGTYYYNCDNGVVTRKVISVNGNGVTTNITTDTLIMSNVPEGTRWGVSNGLITSSYSAYTLVAKNVSVNVNNKEYTDVIIVNFRQYQNTIIKEGYSTNFYYARGVGNIKTEELKDYMQDPMAAYKSQQHSEVMGQSLQGSIDKDIVGVWTWAEAGGGMNTIYQFNSDGTFHYYVGSVSDANEMYKTGKNYWHMNGDTLEVYYSGMNQKYQYGIQKIKDPASGKPALNIQFRGTEYRVYVSSGK